MPANNPHILVLSSWYPTEDSPFLGNFIQRHTDLLGTSYNVTVIVTEASDNIQEISLTQKKIDNHTEIRIKHKRGSNPLQKLILQRKALRVGFKEINKVDLIIGNILIPKGVQFIQAKKHFKCPLIYIENGSYFREKIRENWSFRDKLILKSAKKHIDQIVAVSPVIKADLKRDFTTHPIEVIGNYVNTQAFSFQQKKAKEKKVFLHISTLDENTKNPLGMFEACKILSRKTTDFKFIVISDEDTSKWKKWISQNGLSCLVEFKGPQSWFDLAPAYHSADAFILNSEYESFSVVLAESWSTGTPVITTPVGIAHKMSKDLGIQTQFDNPNSVASAMEKIIFGKVQFDGKKIHSYAQQFSAEETLKSWTKLIEKYAN